MRVIDGPHLDPNNWPPKRDKKLYTKQEIAQLQGAATEFRLSPMHGEIGLLHSRVYVTAAGLMAMAQMHPDYDGLTVEIVAQDWEANFYVAKASVWKKGCSHPFEDFGDADSTTSKMNGRAMFRHAITRAKARALRSAFAVPFVSLEELSDEDRNKQQMTGEPSLPPHPAHSSRDEQPTTVEVPRPQNGAAPKVPTPKQRDSPRGWFFGVASKRGLAEEQQRCLLGVGTRSEASKEQFLA